VAVVGLPGSGKTALLNMIQALYRPTFGVVMVDGHDVTTLEEKWYRSQVATAETVRGSVLYQRCSSSTYCRVFSRIFCGFVLPVW